MNYLKTAYRTQARHKWISLVNLVGLSTGIVCALVIYLYVDGHLSTDNFHKHADRIYRVVLDIHTPSGKIEYDEASALPMGRALNDDFTQVEMNAYCMRFYSTPTITVTGSTGTSRFKDDKVAGYADNNFINLFEHQFLEGDKRTALLEPRTAVISDKQALKYFGTKNALGKTININGITDLVITGIYESQQRSSDLKFDLLVSLPTLKVLVPTYKDQDFTWIGSNNWTFIKLSSPGVGGALEAQLPGFVEKHLGADFKHWNLKLQPLRDIHFDSRYDGLINKSVLWILSGVAVGLILIVSINYINLAIAQSNQRLKEIGVRKYLGAARQQLFWQFMAETFIMVMLSCVISLLAIYIMLPLIRSILQVNLNLIELTSLNSMIFIGFFIAALSVLAGYYPAVFLSGFNPIKAISGKGMGVTANQNLRKVLIVFQYSIALIFMISSLVIVRQVDFFLQTDSGFEKDAIVTVALPKRNYSALKAFSNELSSLKGVRSMAMHHDGPMTAAVDGGFVRYDNRSQFENFIVRDRWTDEDFVETYALSIISGRNIIMHDSTTEVLVNEAFVKGLGDTQDVIGKSVTFDNSAITGKIVGVVKDFHNRSLQSEIEPLAIYPVKAYFNQLAVKFDKVKGGEVLNEIKQKWSVSFPEEVFQYSFLDETLARMYEVERITGNIMRVFAVVSVVICAIGILGLSIFAVQQRKKEIGIRKVLGADVRSIITLLCKQYFVLIAVAIVVAIPLSHFFVSNWLAGFAYHIDLELMFFIVPSLLLIIITLALVGSQSFKAATTNPTDSLKYE